MRMIRKAFRRWRERRRRKAAIAELRGLSDRTLRDMGLTRGEIIAAVDGRVYRGEPVRPNEAKTIDAAGLQSHIEHARQQRAVFVAGLLRRGLGRLVRLLRHQAAARHRPHPMKESRQ